jgi:hypothetical protein
MSRLSITFLWLSAITTYAYTRERWTGAGALKSAKLVLSAVNSQHNNSRQANTLIGLNTRRQIGNTLDSRKSFVDVF